MKLLSTLTLLLLMIPSLHAKDTVVLLHGLMRQPASMSKMASALEAEGYRVLNIDYPSRDQTIEVLAATVRRQVARDTVDSAQVHFVTHSMGGIIVRQIQKSAPLPNIGRVVMLSPPNQGSEVVDKIGHWKAFHFVNGPAGKQLSTDIKGFIAELGPVDFECGILTGDRSINWINSMMIPGKDDGKVSTEGAKVEGMTDYKVVHATHPMIMKKKAVIQEVITFLQTGEFKPANDKP
ncbi:MAG: alpha/beta fold hydrolase [Opitutales bacterium]|jgi:triacylglycerol lipase|nr:alpha/beta fold hydrolase [Opitutales bacterium]